MRGLALQPAVDRAAGSLECAGDRLECRVQRVGDLVGVEAEDVPQHQHRPLPRWQQLQRGDERQRDRLARLVLRFRQ